jgi:glycosyltransferase involved in cell wall biosynthesis
MRILGLVMVRNGEKKLRNTLSAMSEYCDCIYVLNDRSTDNSYTVAQHFPKVRNIFTAAPELSQQDWYFPESQMYELLYRMADFYRPDWIIHLDDDEHIEPAGNVRKTLATIEKHVSCIKFQKVSIWNDASYPELVPLMGKASNISAAIWRYYPGLKAGSQPLHNPRFPVNIEMHGEIAFSDQLKYIHGGWDTLEKRINCVDKYMRLDPDCAFNHKTPYDKGLLFGYKRDEVDLLIQEYRKRYLAAKAGYQ